MKNGAMLYRGPSALGGGDIVAIVTGLRRRSKNPKTGPMLQLWILATSDEPHLAQRSGDDADACCPRECELRPENGGGCYVRTSDAALSVYRAWRRGGYVEASPSVVEGERIRLGAYGDPAALPRELLAEICAASDGWTGYTHAWRREESTDLRAVVMASVETSRDARLAQAEGWRTFHVVEAQEGPGEVYCPSERVSCHRCGLCCGTATAARSVAIRAHGPTATRALRVVA